MMNVDVDEIRIALMVDLGDSPNMPFDVARDRGDQFGVAVRRLERPQSNAMLLNFRA
ncbi:MAG: hypothetical protein ACE15D_10860 [Candidatus Eisenbacteria bacterium]